MLKQVLKVGHKSNGVRLRPCTLSIGHPLSCPHVESTLCLVSYIVLRNCEAATHNLIEMEGIAITRVTTAAYVRDMAVMHDIISREDYNYLIDMMKYRNAIAHGFDFNGFSDGKVTELIAVVLRLLDSEPELA